MFSSRAGDAQAVITPFAKTIESSWYVRVPPTPERQEGHYAMKVRSAGVLCHFDIGLARVSRQKLSQAVAGAGDLGCIG